MLWLKHPGRDLRRADRVGPWTPVRSASLLALLVAGVLSTPTDAQGRDLSWRSLAPAPTPRTEAAAVTLGTDIYLIGGFVPGGVTVPLVEVYDSRADRWRTGPSLPIPVNHAYAASVGDAVYVFGGYLGPAFGGVLQPLALPTDRAFVLEDGLWRPIAPLPEPRGAGGAAVVGHKIYLIGGVDGDSLADKTLVYDTRSDSWATAGGLPTPRQHLGVAGLGRKVFAVGGRIDLLNSNLSASHAYDPSADRWRALPSVGVSRGGLGAAASSNGYVVAVGGEYQGGTYGTAEAFDADRREWIGLPPLPTPRHGLGVVAIGSKIFAIAGGVEAGYSYSGTNESIDLAGLR